MSVTGYQIPVTLAWEMTEHKAQGSKYDTITVDLHRQGRGITPQENLLGSCSVN
jgi:ATP-dependent exoDNAse (exonuclease V) alpha subunit